jgi:hypothetical protein
MTDDERSMAEEYAVLARANYERDGELAPVLVLHGTKRSAICLMKGDEDQPMAYGRTLALATGIFKPDYVVTITEVWMKQVHIENLDKEAVKAETDKIKRGDLGRAAEAGDTQIKTALMTIAWTMDPRRAVTVIDTVLDDKTYDRHTTVGECDGHMAECIVAGWQMGLDLPVPPMEMTDEMIVSLLGMGGDVNAVVLT